MSRVLALDYGTKRIGVALSDETKKIAFAKPYIPFSRRAELVMMVAEGGSSEIIVGMPKNLSGAETAAAEAVRGFAAWLAEETGLPITFIDERFSTKEILREKRGGDKGYRGDKGMVDSLVAQRILQNYLDNNV